MLSSIKDIPDNNKILRVNNVYFCRTEVGSIALSVSIQGIKLQET